jgi:hypothetical protein
MITLVSWALDETETVDMSNLWTRTETNNWALLVELQERDRVDELGILEEILWVHRIAPASKGEGVICLIYESVNCISNKLCDNEKVKKTKEIHDKLEVNIAAYSKD